MKRSGQFIQVSVWLMLLGFFCGMMMPSVSYAKVHRRIDTEGDPEDGLDSSGGSGSSGITNLGTMKPGVGSGWFDLVAMQHFETLNGIFLIPAIVDGSVVFRVIVTNSRSVTASIEGGE